MQRVKEIANRALMGVENAFKDHVLDPATGYYGREGAGAVIYAVDLNRYLLVQRSEHVTESGTWSTVGGIMEPGETPLEACLREIREEIGYAGPYMDTELLHEYVDRDFKYHNFLLAVPKLFLPKLNEENSGFRWCRPGRWPDPLHFGYKAIMDAPESYEKLMVISDKYDSNKAK